MISANELPEKLDLLKSASDAAYLATIHAAQAQAHISDLRGGSEMYLMAIQGDIDMAMNDLELTLDNLRKWVKETSIEER